MRIKLARTMSTVECKKRFGDDVEIYRNAHVSYLSTDTRELKEDDLFVALTGKERNGADFLHEARTCGASAAIARNGLSHLTAWARAYKKEVAPKTVAVTGSVGKSCVKEMLRSLLSERFSVHTSDGNYNTEIGILLTVLAMPEGCEILIAEMGARSAGDIRTLSTLLSPDVGIITAIGRAHVGMLGGIENVKKVKFEITDGMDRNGKLFLGVGVEPPQNMLFPEDFVNRLSDDPRESFAVYAVRSEPQRTCFTVKTEGDLYKDAMIRASGKHMAHNAALAIAAARHLGLSREEILRRLDVFRPLPLRGETEEICGVTLIKDYYNASPESMHAAAELLRVFRGNRPGVRAYAMLGDMLELGDYSEEMHREVGAVFGRLPIDGIFAFGQYKATLLDAAAKQQFAGILSDDPEELASRLLPGDILLVKASRGMHAESWIERLFTKGGYKKK